MTEQQLRTVTPEDLFRLQFLQDARLSPDGKLIAYSLSHVDTANDQEYCHHMAPGARNRRSPPAYNWQDRRQQSSLVAGRQPDRLLFQPFRDKTALYDAG